MFLKESVSAWRCASHCISCAGASEPQKSEIEKPLNEVYGIRLWEAKGCGKQAAVGKSKSLQDSNTERAHGPHAAHSGRGLARVGFPALLLVCAAGTPKTPLWSSGPGLPGDGGHSRSGSENAA